MSHMLGAPRHCRFGQYTVFSYKAYTLIFNQLPTIDAIHGDPVRRFKHKDLLGQPKPAFSYHSSFASAQIIAGYGEPCHLFGWFGFCFGVAYYYWHTPVALLSGTCLLWLAFFHIFDLRYTTPLFPSHHGCGQLGLLIATDPVSSCTSNRGKLIYGAVFGIFDYIFGSWGGYPDGVAFFVFCLMNFAAPLIDTTLNQNLRHKKAKRVFK